MGPFIIIGFFGVEAANGTTTFLATSWDSHRVFRPSLCDVLANLAIWPSPGTVAQDLCEGLKECSEIRWKSNRPAATDVLATFEGMLHERYEDTGDTAIWSKSLRELFNPTTPRADVSPAGRYIGHIHLFFDTGSWELGITHPVIAARMSSLSLPAWSADDIETLLPAAELGPVQATDISSGEFFTKTLEDSMALRIEGNHRIVPYDRFIALLKLFLSPTWLTKEHTAAQELLTSLAEQSNRYRHFRGTTAEFLATQP